MLAHDAAQRFQGKNEPLSATVVHIKVIWAAFLRIEGKVEDAGYTPA